MDAHGMREILNKGWMTHDAMWFYSVFNEYGIEAANRLNLAAIEGMGAIECQRLKKAYGLERDHRFSSFREFSDFFTWVFTIVKPDFMDFEFSFPGENRIRWKWNSCFAHNGMMRIGPGAIEKYQCGVIHRIVVWLRSLGIEYEIEPNVGECLMHRTGSCEGEFRFFFPPDA